MKMIVRQLSGLGNQMFQYAAGLFYAAQCNAQICLITDPPQVSHSHGHPRPFLLSHFAITAQHRELNRADRLLFLTENRRLKPTVGPFLQRHILQNGLHIQIITESLEQRFRFQAELPINHRMQTIYLLGYWQVHNIAEKISADLRREFTFRDSPIGKNLESLRAIRNTENSVSLHIRRGDYTLQAEGNVALAIDYYARAIAHFQASLRNPTFFIFSDDINFAKENVSKDISAVFIDHNDPFFAHEDLRLMSSCRHHIIANSTFSWWGAWLNPSADKIVLAPRNWLVANCPVKNDLFPPSWRLMD
jgi:Glycosyl transferase family 11